MYMKKNPFTLTSDGFSFHTFELRHSLTPTQYSKVLSFIKEKSKETGMDFYPIEQYGGKYYFSSLLQKQGIRIYFSETEHGNFVKLVVNPRKLIDPDAGYIGIFRISIGNFEALYDCFTLAMRKAHLPEVFDDWHLSRLDLCVNLQSSRKKLPMALIFLLSCAGTPAKYERSHDYEELYTRGSKARKNNQKRDARAHRLKLSNRSVNFVAYDKVYQISNEGLKLSSKDKQWKDMGILRVELQLKKKWLNKFQEETGIKQSSQMLESLAYNSKKYICEYVDRLFPFGTYYHAKAAKQRVKNSSDIRKKTKEKMICVIEGVDRLCSFDKAWANVSGSWSKKEKETVLSGFEKLDLNPVPLQRKKILTLPSLSQMLHALDDETDEIQL